MIHISGLALLGLVVAGSLLLMLVVWTFRPASGRPQELPMPIGSKEDLR